MNGLSSYRKNPYFALSNEFGTRKTDKIFGVQADPNSTTQSVRSI